MIVELEKKVPAYPINLNIMPKDVSYGDIKIESGDFNLLSLFKGYIDQLETKVDKKELYDGFMELFNMAFLVNILDPIWLMIPFSDFNIL